SCRLTRRRPPRSPLFPYTTLFRSDTRARFPEAGGRFPSELWDASASVSYRHKFDNGWTGGVALTVGSASDEPFNSVDEMYFRLVDRKSTRLNSSHVSISYAVFCLK